MTLSQPGASTVHARILYWGIAGAGKSANLRAVFAKLRPDHREPLREIPTRLDPSVHTEVLPISLGDVAGVKTQIEIVTAPGAPEHAPTRKQMLDGIDGVVLVIDSQRDRTAQNLASVEELRRSLSAYGRALEDVPIVVQYNKRDLADSFSLDELHRKLGIEGAAVFEAVATEGTGVLQTLSTISKQVIRTLRNTGARERASAPAPSAREAQSEAATRAARNHRVPAPAKPNIESRPSAPAAPPKDRAAKPASRELAAMLEHDAFGEEARAVESAARRIEDRLDDTWTETSDELLRLDSQRNFRLVAVGKAVRTGDRSLRIPLSIGDELGETTELVLNLSLDLAERERER
jgi:signal recognition particle receptor subunit beta